jgi:hypothetical protein
VAGEKEKIRVPGKKAALLLDAPTDVIAPSDSVYLPVLAAPVFLLSIFRWGASAWTPQTNDAQPGNRYSASGASLEVWSEGPCRRLVAVMCFINDGRGSAETSALRVLALTARP